MKKKNYISLLRQGEDLIMNMEVQLVESLCGFQKPIKTLDSRTLLITSHPGKPSCIHIPALHASYHNISTIVSQYW